VHIGGDIGHQTRLGFGGRALFPVQPSGSLTPYLGLRGGYAWYSESDAPKEWNVVGIFGARYALDKRFGVSGETGIVYDHLHELLGPFAGSTQPFGATQTSLEPWGRVSALVYF
jgi:hypothetical protein